MSHNTFPAPRPASTDIIGSCLGWHPFTPYNSPFSASEQDALNKIANELALKPEYEGGSDEQIAGLAFRKWIGS